MTYFYFKIMFFIENFYNSLMVEKIVKMYVDYEEILKHPLVTPGIEASIIKLPARRLRPSCNSYFCQVQCGENQQDALDHPVTLTFIK